MLAGFIPRNSPCNLLYDQSVIISKGSDDMGDYIVGHFEIINGTIWPVVHFCPYLRSGTRVRQLNGYPQSPGFKLYGTRNHILRSETDSQFLDFPVFSDELLRSIIRNY